MTTCCLWCGRPPTRSDGPRRKWLSSTEKWSFAPRERNDSFVAAGQISTICRPVQLSAKTIRLWRPGQRSHFRTCGQQETLFRLLFVPTSVHFCLEVNNQNVFVTRYEGLNSLIIYRKTKHWRSREKKRLKSDGMLSVVWTSPYEKWLSPDESDGPPPKSDRSPLGNAMIRS